MFTAHPTRKQLSAVICLALALVTAALYWPMLHHDFICLDDDSYLVSNPQVNKGLTWAEWSGLFKAGTPPTGIR